MPSSWRDHFLEAFVTAAHAADDRRLASRRGELQDGTRLHIIQDPASKLTPREEVSVVRYMIGQDDWRKAADS